MRVAADMEVEVLMVLVTLGEEAVVVDEMAVVLVAILEVKKDGIISGGGDSGGGIAVEQGSPTHKDWPSRSWMLLPFASITL